MLRPSPISRSRYIKDAKLYIPPLLLSLLGFTAGDGGRLPQGLKYDTLKAMRDVFSSEVGTETAQIIGARVCELQADRKTASPRISASPESLMNAVKAGKLSLDQLKEAIAGLEG